MDDPRHEKKDAAVDLCEENYDPSIGWLQPKNVVSFYEVSKQNINDGDNYK
jgi:hypothetical protein